MCCRSGTRSVNTVWLKMAFCILSVACRSARGFVPTSTTTPMSMPLLRAAGGRVLTKSAAVQLQERGPFLASYSSVAEPESIRCSRGARRASFTRKQMTALIRLITTTALSMVRNRGLEVNPEGATPTVGGMTLYCKAGPDGTSVGDCPFAHFVRMVLHEKGLEYELRPTTQDTKPLWLIEHYGGSMPALRHRKECYTESDVIAQYLDYFFQDPPLGEGGTKKEIADAKEAIDGFFPAVARYLKHTPDGDEEDEELKTNLENALSKLENHLMAEGRTGPYLVGNGETFGLLDCSLGPKLYHMEVGLVEFKNNAIDIEKDFPAVRKYMNAVYDRPSFTEASYPKETVVWGWSNARK